MKGSMNKQELLLPYSRKSMKRLKKILESQRVTPWLNPVTNSISVRKLNFIKPDLGQQHTQ